MGGGSSVCIETRYRLDGPEIEFRWGEIFRIRPDWPWVPPSLLYNGHLVSSGIKRPWRGTDHPTPYSAEVKERIELHLYSPSGPSWPVIRWPSLQNVKSQLRKGIELFNVSSSDLDLAAERGHPVHYSTSPSRHEVVMAHNIRGSVSETKVLPCQERKMLKWVPEREGWLNKRRRFGNRFVGV